VNALVHWLVVARILVIDDDPHVGKLFVKSLQNAGYTVDLAGSGRDGLRMATAEVFDVIVLDLSMPEPDGFEVLAKLKAKQASSPPVVMVSGWMGESLLRAAEHLGAAASLSKAEGPRRLIEIVADVLSLRRQ